MQHLRFPVALITGLLLSIGVSQPQSAGPVTATCNDGTSFTGAKRSGACRGHGGVQAWGPAGESSGVVTPAIEPAAHPASTRSAAEAPGNGTGMVAATSARTVHPSRARSAPVPAEAMGACSHGARPKQRLSR
jgi:hypothetical protein